MQPTVQGQWAVQTEALKVAAEEIRRLKALLARKEKQLEDNYLDYRVLESTIDVLGSGPSTTGVPWTLMSL